MTETVKDRIKENLGKAKLEGMSRAGRIREILQTAFSQTLTEVKQGSGELSSIATQSIAVVTESINPESSGASSTSLKDQVLALFIALRDRLTARWQTLDTTLSTQYGDRYATVKQRWNQVTVWYNNARANSETPLSDQLQQRQALVEQKVSNAGVSIARKEEQIRQQLRTFFQSATTKS